MCVPRLVAKCELSALNLGRGAHPLPQRCIIRRIELETVKSRTLAEGLGPGAVMSADIHRREGTSPGTRQMSHEARLAAAVDPQSGRTRSEGVVREVPQPLGNFSARVRRGR
jgi:hypothetical protein